MGLQSCSIQLNVVIVVHETKLLYSLSEILKIERNLKSEVLRVLTQGVAKEVGTSVPPASPNSSAGLPSLWRCEGWLCLVSSR